jgi:ribosomal-protein-alanine N-acetyltransferase
MKKLFEKTPYLEGEGITLKAVTLADKDGMQALVDSPAVQRYLPTFLFEQQYDDMEYVINHLYDECLEESLILGIYQGGAFCGLAEMYGYRQEIHKVSIGYRLLEERWGKGIATETVRLMTEYLLDQTDIELITASTMVDNKASAHVLEKCGFIRTARNVPEDWGFAEPILTDKWFC